jgi:3-demethoxyubiquinol 3-hydroxylase
MRERTQFDDVLIASQAALATLTGSLDSSRDYPAAATASDELDPAQRALSAALMRVNHVGEICAQALYEAQALATADSRLRDAFRSAAAEEADHLAWTRRRIQELGGRTSLLSPLWFAGSFAIGLVAGRLGDRASLGFMAETERQVEQHLAGHLERLPDADQASRTIVAQMKEDEARHGRAASDLGGVDLPAPVRGAMRLAAMIMTTTAHWI